MKLIIAAAGLCTLLVGIWLGGVRVVVIQPIGAIPEGVTVIVAGIEGVRMVDSPDAICARKHGGVSLLCRGATAAAIARNGKILLRLPYSETLFRFTGGPFRSN